MINIVKQEIIDYGGIKNYLCAQQHKVLLSFLTCGSVDDGKSTLIGRLLHDSGQIYEDQLSILREDSKRISAQKNKLDLALLVDGLQSERTQGITIDVAYRYFFTKKRKFIIADTPGHEEYTKNMATGASTSELAVLLVDARKGIRKQTRRHFLISALLGIRYIIVVVNKMDLVNYEKIIFDNICEEYLEFTKSYFDEYSINTQFVPVVALDGDNIVIPSMNMQWYKGPTLLDMLESIQINSFVHLDSKKMRFPVQYVIRDNLDFRGYSGTIASGNMHIGQNIRVFPSRVTSVIRRIIVSGQDQKCAWSGEAVAITLEDDIDVSRGDMLIDFHEKIDPVSCVVVDVVWMANQELKNGQYFYVKIATKIVKAQIESIQYQIDMDTFLQKKTDRILLNDIGVVRLLFEEPLILDKYSCYPVTGSMVFIDLLTNETVGAGMVRCPITDHNLMLNKGYSKFEVALHDLIRFHFPHWNIHDLS